MNRTILVTGGAGYIGSHACVLLLEAGFSVIVLDNLSNSQASVLQRIEQITKKSLVFIEGDIRNQPLLDQVFNTYSIDAVIHFAGLKAVGESVQQPLAYYDCNIHGTNQLLQTMKRSGVKRLIFSSSATVYGEPQYLPITEDHPLSSTNPYGHSKLVIEQVLSYLYQSDPEWSIVCLRYFNPVGAHPSGLIGETPQGTPNNLMPYVMEVASGQREKVRIFGHDYSTPDGTGVRDYIHVMDLAQGHLAALDAVFSAGGELLTVNLGTGIAYSVLEIIHAVEKSSGKAVPYEFTERRIGDVAACWADTTYAKQRLQWEAKLGIEQMCTDGWRWVARGKCFDTAH